MKLVTFLLEQRLAPLYHGTNLTNAILVLQDNILYTGIDWRGEGDRIATSRDYRKAHSFGKGGLGLNDYGVIFVLDQDKISQNIKIEPHRDYDMHGEYWGTDEQEEKIMGDLKPLSKYLLSINIDPSILKKAYNDEDFYNLMLTEYPDRVRDVEHIQELLHKLANHPLLNKVLPRTKIS